MNGGTFQNMAPNAKRSFFVTVTLAAIATVIYLFCVQPCSDEPFRALPLPNPMPRQLHTRVAVKLTATGSYQQAVSFLLRLEKEMPLVSLQKLDITARSTPESQSITMVLEWPAKGGLTRK